MDGELYEALDAARKVASQPAALSLSPQAQARMAHAAGAVPAAADDPTKIDDRREQPATDTREVAAVAHVDVRA